MMYWVYSSHLLAHKLLGRGICLILLVFIPFCRMKYYKYHATFISDILIPHKLGAQATVMLNDSYKFMSCVLYVI